MNNVLELKSYNCVPIQQSLDKNKIYEKIIGSHFMGMIGGDENPLTYTRLCELFGTPMMGRDNKSFCNWVLEFEDGLIATIYDYKSSKKYLGEDGLSVNDMKSWHIGGHDEVVFNRVQKILDMDMTYYEAIVMIEKAFLMMKSKNVPFNYEALHRAWSKIQRGV